MWEALAREGNVYRGVLRRCEWVGGVVFDAFRLRRGAVMPGGLAWVCVPPAATLSCCACDGDAVQRFKVGCDLRF